jgi:diguanylate cyclase (GGDEF)-like protein/PAS domain S-box-containing protein
MNFRGKKRKLHQKWLIFSLLFTFVVVGAGWLATGYLGDLARQEIVQEHEATIALLSTLLTDDLQKHAGAAEAISGSPWILPALISGNDRDIARANAVLDRYNSALGASVSYLMDNEGKTIASSNRHDPDSFIGKSYQFRPYFTQAISGQAGRYFALGVTSLKRGFYASYPVRDGQGAIIGVAAMKKDLKNIEVNLRGDARFFFINPQGVIFLSNNEEMLFKILWPLSKETEQALLGSKQFGEKPFAAVMPQEISDGMDVTLNGKRYLVSRKVIDPEGWSIVLLAPTDRIRIYQLIGILTTIFVCLLIVIFSGVIYVTDRSKEALRQSEERSHLLLHSAGEGIFGVDVTGLVTFVNPAALRLLGFAAEELLGQRVHAAIHHSHEGGSIYPVVDCPMYASYTQGAKNQVSDEVLWRKDGSSFPVEYSSTPITKDGQVTGAVVTFRDITDRKQAEEIIHQMAYHDSLTGLPNRKLFSDRLGIALAQAQRNQKVVAIAMLDLDHFKEVNDTLGHDVGDLLLKATAERLRAALRDSDTVARIGGDEFALILPDLKGIKDAIQVAQKIVDGFRKPFPINTHQLLMTTSIGIAVYPDDGTDEGMLLKNADQAMYQAKQTGRDRYRFYETDLKINE